MAEFTLMQLQNGSDIRGVATKTKGEKVVLTPDVANCIGQAFAEAVARIAGKKVTDIKIATGMDCRLSGPALMEAVSAGAHTAGATVLDCGLTSTPAMFMSCIYPETDCDGALMVTASHMPPNKNGFKFFTKKGGFEKGDITQLLTRAQEILDNMRETYDLQSLYAARLCDYIKENVKAEDYDHPLTGLKIVVDAGNGNGGFFAYKVLAPLGADISGSQYLDPDGKFPHHEPNPEDNKAMRAICDATLNAKANLGLIFDTDVDRMSAVFSDGTPVSRDACIALIASIISPGHEGGTIVTDSVTSDRLTDFLENTLKMKHYPYMRGYKNVINKCIELNESGIDCPLAMETSGHGCLKENHYLDDGAFLAVQIIIALAKAHASGKRMASLLDGFSMAFSAREVRFKILDADFAEYGKEVLADFRKRAEKKGYDLPSTHEGVRVRFAEGTLGKRFTGGWVHLRSSLHDPVMVLNMEGKTEADLYMLTLQMKNLMEDFWKLDISAL